MIAHTLENLESRSSEHTKSFQWFIDSENFSHEELKIEKASSEIDQSS